MDTKQGEPITTSAQELITVTSAKGVGKTTFLSQYLRPSEIGKTVYVDTENSANRFISEMRRSNLEYGMYINTMDRFSNLPSDDDLLDKINKGNVPWASSNEKNTLIDFFKYFMKTIAQIPRNKYKTFVIDTGEQIEAGMQAYVDANKSKFGVTNDWTLWTMGIYPLYKFMFQGIWDRGIDTVLISFHIKDAAEGWGRSRKKIPGKVVPGGKPMLKQISNFMVWLVGESHNPNGEPAGLVLKERLGRYEVDTVNDEWISRTMIPKRIPCCTWKDIRKYLEDGYNNVQPSLDPSWREVPSDTELDMISELLNDTQTRLMILGAEADIQNNMIAMAEAGIIPTMETETIQIGSRDVPQSKSEAIVKWMAMGKPLPDLLAKLREKGIGDDNIVERWSEVLE